MAHIVRRLSGGALAVAALAVAGCGGEEEAEQPTPAPAPPPAAGGPTLRLSAEPSGQLRFDKDMLRADPGKLTIVMDNPAPVPHNVAIEGQGVDVKGPVVSKGGVSRVSATVKAGKYTYYCSVAGHREGGMVGTLTVG
jgi:plastocyanin